MKFGFHMLQSNIVASGGLGCEVFIWDLEAAMVPLARASNEAADESKYDGFPPGLSVSTDRSSTANSNINAPGATLPNSYVPIPAKGHKESVYALAMNDTGTVLVSGGTEKVSFFLHAIELGTQLLCFVQSQWQPVGTTANSLPSGTWTLFQGLMFDVALSLLAMVGSE
jgi:hypothetical protein